MKSLFIFKLSEQVSILTSLNEVNAIFITYIGHLTLKNGKFYLKSAV